MREGTGWRDVLRWLNGPVPTGKFRGVQFAITPLAILWFIALGLLGWWVPVVLMVTIGIHEYGHSLMGERLKYTPEVFLFEPMGARVVMGPRVQTVNDDMWISIAGPLVNLVVGLVLLPVVLLLYYMDLEGSPAFVPIAGTCVLNLGLALFNMLPIYPMDGGRIFRGWAIKKYGWKRGNLLTRNVGVAIGLVLGGVCWIRKYRLLTLLMVPYVVDCIRGLELEERLWKQQDPFTRLKEWGEHQKRKQDS